MSTAAGVALLFATLVVAVSMLVGGAKMTWTFLASTADALRTIARGRDHAWGRTAGRLGLRVDPTMEPSLFYVRTDGSRRALLGPCPSWLRPGEQPCTLTVEGLPLGIEVWPDGEARHAEVPRLSTGDTELDQRVWLSGREERLIPLLDARARAIILALTTHSSLSIRAGRLTLDLPHTTTSRAGGERLSLALELADRLAAAGSDVPASLLARCSGDPCPGARAMALVMLNDEAGSVAHELARADPDPMVRSVGRWVGALHDPSAVAPPVSELPPVLARTLLARVPGDVPSPRFDAALIDAVHHPRSAVRLAAVQVRARRRQESDHAALLGLAAEARHLDVASAAVAALRDWERPDRTAALVALLQRVQSASREAARAARAVGDTSAVGAGLALIYREVARAVGDVSAVEPLLALIHTGGGARFGAVTPEGSALRRIQARAGIVEWGQLALVSDEGGELAVVGEGGELAVASWRTPTR